MHKEFFIRHLFLELYCRRHEQAPKTVTDQRIFCSKTPVPGAQAPGVKVHRHLVGTEKSAAEDSILHASGMFFDNYEGSVPSTCSHICA